MMQRTVMIQNQFVTFKSSATISQLYRLKFKCDIFKDLSKLKKSYKGNGSSFEIDDLDIFENVAYIMVYNDARVYGDALIDGSAKVYGSAIVSGNACVYDDAEVFSYALVYGRAEVFGDAHIYDGAQVCGDAQVYGNAQVCGDVLIGRDAIVCGDQRVDDEDDE